ncbi:hypothetical protein [Luteolibacter soli]|uniref:Uncharacterized protein n=1 Tax=Luteolibacter soli TaxID=3135280 RepID=A0ABU9ARV3_9BACT
MKIAIAWFCGALVFIILNVALEAVLAAISFKPWLLGTLGGTAFTVARAWGSFWCARKVYSIIKNAAGRALVEVVQELAQLGEEYPAVRSILPIVAAAIKAQADTIRKQIRLGEVTPRQVALQFAGNTAGDALESGKWHLYRGVLSPAGNELMRLYDACWRANVADGFATEEKRQEEMAMMHRLILQVG